MMRRTARNWGAALFVAIMAVMHIGCVIIPQKKIAANAAEADPVFASFLEAGVRLTAVFFGSGRRGSLAGSRREEPVEL